MLIEKMAVGLGLQPKFIETFAHGASHAYKWYQVPKHNGEPRDIYHPSQQLKSLQRWLLNYTLPDFPVHPAAMAYQKGKSILKNASVHAASKYLLRMDFEDFFPAIIASDLSAYRQARPGLFIEWTDLDFEIARMIIFRHGHLTIGAPTSPAISNILCIDMDTVITDFCGKRGVAYTRYADDLFFSTIEPGVLHPLEHDIEALVVGLTMPSHLTMNLGKTRHSSRTGARRVTGIVLGSDRKPHVGRDLKRAIRAMIHKVDSLDPGARARLSGLLGYAVGFDRKFMNRLIIKYGNDPVC